jgi:hippurate hydrolase
MNISQTILDMQPQLAGWRQHIHAHPETAFEEHATADFITNRLEELGLAVERGIGETGLVASLSKGSGKRIIGLRADMDALFIQEENRFEYASRNSGKMHACGHDGHTTMLLGAARYLCEHGKFNGTVRFIFQPAEETGNERCGGNTMIQDGLFERHPVDCVFAMHNFPGLPVGQFAMRSGPMLASIDTFEFKVHSEFAHPAMQHETPDPLLAAARIVDACHAFKARRVNPAEPVILSITQFQSGHPHDDKPGVHVTPDEAYVRGTVYTLNDDMRDVMEQGLRRIVEDYARAEGARVSFSYERGYPVLVNSEQEKNLATQAATAVVGEDKVQAEMQPVMGAEDFAFMLQKKPGCYVFIGNGSEAGPDGHACHLHNPHYDFNDQAIPVGVQYFANLVESYLTADTDEPN